MSVEQNKQLVTQTWNAMVAGDIKTAFANLSDEISWLIPSGAPGEMGGLKRGKPALLEFFRSAAKMFPGGLKSEIRRTYGDGDTVIIELINRGKMLNGRDYENEYCFIFELDNGKIRRIREYVDTAKVRDLMS